MNELEIKQLWQNASLQLEAQQALLSKHTAELANLKVKGMLSGMKPVKFLALIVGILWVLLLDLLLLAVWDFASVWFLFSALGQVIITKLAIGIYVYQLAQIHGVDLGEPIIAVQERLARLQISTLWAGRILALQLPLWTTFYWNASMLENGHWLLWLFQAIVTLGFTVLAFWLFGQIRYENRHKKWFKWMFSGNEWEPINKAMETLDELGNYKAATV